MNKITGARISGALAGAALVLAALPAMAQSPADLGRSLTPLGGIQAGNAEGSIPPWTGGITTPPAGFSPVPPMSC